MKNQKMADAYKNAIGTVFLLAGAFFICSTLLSMRTVLADPIAPTTVAQSQVSPARAAARNNGTVARSTVARSRSARTVKTSQPANTSSSRTVKTRSISVRGNDGNVRNVQKTASRSIVSRGTANNTTMRGVSSRNSQRVIARTTSTPSRVSLIGNGLRASTSSGVTVSYLTNKLYTGNYANIIDSTTGLISADAYSNCLESYYTCMDEICTARSDAKGRCSCAGRATNFLDAETALEKANEELISLSGQLALLISTKGKDVSEAFKLTDAEKVMNCVSYKDAKTVAGTTKDSAGNIVSSAEYMKNWCRSHMMYADTDCGYDTEPSYCSSKDGGNDFGFDLSSIDGSSSDILASLQAWANAKDLAKQYTDSNTGKLYTQYTTIAGVVNGLTDVTSTTVEQAKLDDLANKWGYELFEYAHNNVCGRVLDSCFNGIYEACGTPPSGTDSSGNKIGKCANGASSSCPYNYNSAIYVNSKGDVQLNERGSTGSTTSTSASCFGYTTSSGDPYSSLRGPVADARRSIMQKYLLDTNAACDAYGTSLKNTAQNINYQKIAAEQALRQKRMDFYNEEEKNKTSEAVAAVSNFNECISEIWDCYNENADEENWSTARIKTYCAQVANVPHCYETMICNPTQVTMAVVDDPDSPSCKYDADNETNTCRNIVTLNEILYGATIAEVSTGHNDLADMLTGHVDNANSAKLREACLRIALNCTAENNSDECLRNWTKPSN